MSKISEVYSDLVNRITEVFQEKTRLHNPYNLEENPDIVRKNSWGLKVETATKEDAEYCNLTLVRTFTAIIMRQFVSLASKEDGFDVVTMGLLEDQQTLAQLLHSPNELNQQSNIDIINIENISGIQEMVTGEKKYLFSEVTFTITISELIS